MSAHMKIEALESRLLLTTNPASVQIGDTLYFHHYDTVHGGELWKSDLDGSNAQLVKDILPGNESGNVVIPKSSIPKSFYNFNGILIFTAESPSDDSNGQTRALARSDGTAEGTVPIADMGTYLYDVRDYTELNGRLLFLAGYEADLYVTDGTTEGTARLFADSHSYYRQSVLGLLEVQSELLYFSVSSSDHRQAERWQTDGTLAGTRHIPPGVRIIDGSLDIEGTTGNDDILITADATTTTVVLNGVLVKFDNSTFQTIWVDGQNGNDRIFLTTDVKQDATLLGGAGNDSLTGGGGNDDLVGGTGNDTADCSSETMAISTAGGYGARFSFNSSDRGSDALSLETLLSGSGDDRISVHSTVTDGLQYIHGGAGNDGITLTRTEIGGPVVHGGQGNDTISGSHYGGSSSLYGDDGDDRISVGPRARTGYSVSGGAGYDIVRVGLRWADEPLSNYLTRYPDVEGIIDNNNPTVIPTVPPPPPPTPPASPAIDNLSLDYHILRIDGTSNSDRITVRRSSADASVLQVVLNGKIRSFNFADVNAIIIDGKQGDDWINLKGITIASTILGGKGNDTILGSDAADSIVGGTGDDSIYGYAGNDNLGGNDGNDYICGGAGVDAIRGGGGTDRLVGRFRVDNLRGNNGDQLINELL